MTKLGPELRGRTWLGGASYCLRVAARGPGGFATVGFANVESEATWWRSGRAARVVSTLAIVGPGVAYLMLAWFKRWTSDDGFINYRVVAQITDGSGPVFNAGERVEAVTSPLWIAILAAARFGLPDGIQLEYIGLWLSLTAAVFGIVAASLGARRIARVREPNPGAWLIPFGSLIVVGLRPFWEFATSGLEMGLLLGWIGASFWALVAFVQAPALQRSTWRFPLAVLLGLGPIIRPDIALFSVCFVVALLVADAEGRWPGRIALVATGLAIPIVYQVFRMGYYGALIPNTAIAKSAGTQRWDRGLDYLWNLIHPYRLEIPLALVAVALIVTLAGLWRRERRLFVVVASPVVAGLAHGLYVVGIGGDFMHARLLLPALFSLAMPVADEHAIYTFESRNRNPVTLADYHVVPWLEPAETAQRAITRGERVVDVPPIGSFLFPGATDVERRFPLRAGIDARAAIAFGRIGALSYAVGPDVFILNRFGLGDPLGSRLDAQASNKPGHERFVSIPGIEARLAVRSYEDPDPIRAAGAEFGRKALGCGDLADLMEAVSEPLTPGRFLTNLASSPRFTELRVPDDPTEADAEFCDRP